MMTRIQAFAIATALMAAAGVQAQVPAGDDPQSPEISAIVAAFHDALAAGDSTAALALLHDDAVIYEGGHAETRTQYRSGHLASDIAFSNAVARRITADDVLVNGDVALYTSEYASAGTFRGRDIDSHGTETMVLVRTADGWQIRHIHWSSR